MPVTHRSRRRTERQRGAGPGLSSVEPAQRNPAQLRLCAGQRVAGQRSSTQVTSPHNLRPSNTSQLLPATRQAVPAQGHTAGPLVKGRVKAPGTGWQGNTGCACAAGPGEGDMVGG